MDHVEKAKRIDRIKTSVDEDDVRRQLPEIESLSEEHQELVIEGFLTGVPDYFWIRASSSSGKYHSDDECGEYGNLLHTKRVFTIFDRLARSWVEQGLISEQEQEFGRLAVLFHDTMKYGWPSEQNNHTTDEHDIIAAAVGRHIIGLPDETTAAIESHMGSWASGPNPQTDLQQLVHTADMIASDPEIDIAVLEPSEELRSIRDDLPAIERD
jgi:hypothetical protein